MLRLFRQISLHSSIFALFLCFFSVSSLVAEQTVYPLDTTTSVIKWKGSKVSGSHDGTVKLTKGEISFGKKEIESGTFTISMASIVNTDIEDAKWRKKLEDHLKSDDFFSVSTHPEAVFEISKVENRGETPKEDDFMVSGTLSVKGISKKIRFPATIKKVDDTYTATAKFQINRLDWDIKYNSGKFFDINKLGDKLIYDRIEIELNLKTLAAKKRKLR